MRLLELPVHTGEDVFALRQQGRHVAAAVGFDDPDQVRLATALSELGRDVHGLTEEGGSVNFDIDTTAGALVISVVGLQDRHVDAAVGIVAARRLMPLTVVAPGSGAARTVIMSKPLPRPLGEADVRGVRLRIAGHTVTSPLDELRTQNREVLAALEQITARQGELEELNGELEETNRGVMAMYAQLSDELETTNRGVLALYAELDDKSRLLQQASEAKSRFLSSVSHELRSPISSILGLTRLLLDPLGQPLHEEQRQQVELINSAASELFELVSQLLDLARAESDKLQPVMTPVDIGAVIRELVSVMDPIAAADVTLTAHVSEQPVVIVTDEALVRTVVRNLMANALSFTEHGTVDVVLGADRPNAQLILEVRDSGIGIPPDAVDRIFEEFFQVRNHLQTRRRGTGLGLPYARRVAEVLGGTLRATSALGAGSTFTLTLPITPEASGDRPDREITGPAAGVFPLRRAIVADDDAGFRAVIVQMLKGIVAEIIETDDGSTVCDEIRRTPTDVVLLDLVMPALGGADVLAAMRADASLRTPAVIVTSMDVRLAPDSALPADAIVLAKQDLTVEVLRAAISKVTAQQQRG